MRRTIIIAAIITTALFTRMTYAGEPDQHTPLLRAAPSSAPPNPRTTRAMSGSNDGDPREIARLRTEAERSDAQRKAENAAIARDIDEKILVIGRAVAPFSRIPDLVPWLTYFVGFCLAKSRELL